MKWEPQNILIKDYTYELPHYRIAEYPLEERHGSKLLVYEKGKIRDDVFYNIGHYLPPGATLVLNNTRVIEARLLFRKPTGGVIEIFCLEAYEQTIEQAMQQKEGAVWKCLIGGASKWKPGQVLEKELLLEDATVFLSATYLEKREDYFLIKFNWYPAHLPFVQILHDGGSVPLPPYIKREPEKLDGERYQTIFGTHDGSVAAPTAALHFTEKVFEELSQRDIQAKFVTLHVGAGTFKPVKSATIAEHQMHGEPFTVKKEVLQDLIKASSIVAVGTTSLRTLESLYWLGLKLPAAYQDELQLHQWDAYQLAPEFVSVPYQQSLEQLINWMEKHDIPEVHCRTSLIIVPGYEFKIPTGLITNFHQPQSTLLLLIAAFIGNDWRGVYQHALRHDYRFLSYGDSSLLWRNNRMA